MGNDLIIRFYSNSTCWLVFYYFFDNKKKPSLISNKFEHMLLFTEKRILSFGLCAVPNRQQREYLSFFNLSV